MWNRIEPTCPNCDEGDRCDSSWHDPRREHVESDGTVGTLINLTVLTALVAAALVYVVWL